MIGGKILIIAILFFAFQICLINCGKNKRGLLPEDVAMEIYFKGSCRRIQEAVRSIRVSSQPVNDTCLPIRVSAPFFPDNNDLNYHVLCTDIGKDRKRSLLRLVEVFNGTDDSVPLPAGISYVVSIKTRYPFRVNIPNVSYQYRPKCFYENDICNSSVSIVSSCKQRPVLADDDIDEDGYVESIRRVYVILPGVTINSCSTGGVCCPYISASSNGICKFYNRSLTHSDPWRHNHGQPNHHGSNDHNGHHDDDYDDEHDDHHGDHHDDHHDHDDHHHDHDEHHHHGKDEKENDIEVENKENQEIKKEETKNVNDKETEEKKVEEVKEIQQK